MNVWGHTFNKSELQRFGCRKERQTCTPTLEHSMELRTRLAFQLKPHPNLLNRSYGGCLPAAKQFITSYKVQVWTRLRQESLLLELLHKAKRTHDGNLSRARKFRCVSVLPARSRK